MTVGSGGASSCVDISQRTVGSIHVDGNIPSGLSEYHLPIASKWHPDHKSIMIMRHAKEVMSR